MKFEKLPKSFEEQVDLLASRGLVVRDRKGAVEFLSAINYYRFSAYCLPFEIARHSFIGGTEFEYIERLYEFDRRLRVLVSDIIEPIEISIRTHLVYHLAHAHGAFAHEDSRNFKAGFNHSQWTKDLREETERSQEVFVQHFKTRYEEYPRLPIWAAVEIMSFGRLSTLYSGLTTADKQAVANIYALKAPVLHSWLHTLVYIRNLCAHHARLWNREIRITPMLPDKDPRWKLRHPRRLGCALYLLNWLVSHIARREALAADWRLRVEGLIGENPGVGNFLPAMGLEPNWMENPLWGANP